jgi:hypothetical protein
VLLQHEELKLIISVYPGTVVTDPERYAADHACRYLRMQRLAFPVPFDLVFHRANGGGSVAPDDTKAPIKGMLQRCP